MRAETNGREERDRERQRERVREEEEEEEDAAAMATRVAASARAFSKLSVGTAGTPRTRGVLRQASHRNHGQIAAQRRGALGTKPVQGLSAKVRTKKRHKTVLFFGDRLLLLKKRRRR